LSAAEKVGVLVSREKPSQTRSVRLKIITLEQVRN